MIYPPKFFLLIIFLVGSLLAAGCTSSSMAPVAHAGDTNITTTPTLYVTTIIPVASLTTVQCPPKSNSSFITINPILHTYCGDIITFDGTTNLAPGETIILRIVAGIGRCSKGLLLSDSVDGCHGDGMPMAVTVKAGNAGCNTWSGDVNTSQHGFRPDQEYFIDVSWRNGVVRNSSFFIVSGMPKPNITLNLPENDPNIYAIRLSGQANTGNGPDEKFLLTVSSDSGRNVNFTIPVVRTDSGFYWNFTLEKSAITPYNFYSVNVTSKNNPEIRILRTFRYDNEPEFYPYNSNSP